MVTLYIILASILSAFMFDYFSKYNTISEIFRYQKESRSIMKSIEISDDKKQKLLLHSAGKIFLSTVNLNIFLGIICLPYLLLIFYFGPWMSKKVDYFHAVSSFKGLVICVSTFIIYYLVKKENKTSDYTAFQRFFHRITLGFKPLMVISFDIEKKIFLKKWIPDYNTGQHVFVTGLARSGTTALMNTLHETKEFTSLTYSDMPLLLAPNLWNTLSLNKSASEPKERAHKDGIYIHKASPEALDEAFWKTHIGKKYIHKRSIVITEIPTEVLDDYENYINLILLKYKSENTGRYLSKNNNNVLRIPEILYKFPKSKIIITFRSPLDHALSLLNQHQHFKHIQKESSFSLSYMNWLGHHEFGLGQKPFHLEDDELFQQLDKYLKDDINYWLLIWLNYYQYVLKYFTYTCILVSYESFCKNPNKVMTQLGEKIALDHLRFDLKSFKPEKRTSKLADKTILASCKKVYEELSLKAVY